MEEKRIEFMVQGLACEFSKTNVDVLKFGATGPNTEHLGKKKPLINYRELHDHGPEQVKS